MSGELVRAAIVASLQELASVFAAGSVTPGNFQVLDSGAPPYAVVIPGPFQSEPVPGFSRTPNRQQTTDHWTVDAYLFEKHNGDGTEYDNIERTRAAVITKLRKTIMPGGQPLRVTSGNELQEVYDEDENGPFFLLQIVRCENMELAVS